jgi:hypothetical protein
VTKINLETKTLDALDLQKDEQVLWASVQSGESGSLPPKPKENWLRRLKPWQIGLMFVSGVLLLFVSRQYPIQEELGFFIQVCGLLFVGWSVGYVCDRLWQLSPWGRRRAQFGPYAFLSCVITNQRVLFFDLPREQPLSVMRSQLANVKQGFAKGAQALLFYPRELAVTYAFISTLDFKPALRALNR